MKHQKHESMGRSSSIALLCAMLFGGCTNHDIESYQEKMRTYDARESMALELYKMPDTASKATILAEIKDRGLYYWQQNIDLVHEMDNLDLPDSLHVQDKKMLDYCNLRIKSYNLIYKYINEGSPNYKDSISFTIKKSKWRWIT